MGIFFHVYTLLYNIGEWRSFFFGNAEKDVSNADGYPMKAGKIWGDCKINSYSGNKRGSFA